MASKAVKGFSDNHIGSLLDFHVPTFFNFTRLTPVRIRLYLSEHINHYTSTNHVDGFSITLLLHVGGHVFPQTTTLQETFTKLVKYLKYWV